MSGESQMIHPYSERARKAIWRTTEQSWSEQSQSSFWTHKGSGSDWELPAWIYKDKSCQTNLIASCGEMALFTDERKADNAVYFEFIKAFHVVFHIILVSNFIWSSLDRQNNVWIIGQNSPCSI